MMSRPAGVPVQKWKAEEAIQKFVQSPLHTLYYARSVKLSDGKTRENVYLILPKDLDKKDGVDPNYFPELEHVSPSLKGMKITIPNLYSVADTFANDRIRGCVDFTSIFSASQSVQNRCLSKAKVLQYTTDLNLHPYMINDDIAENICHTLLDIYYHSLDAGNLIHDSTPEYEKHLSSIRAFFTKSVMEKTYPSDLAFEMRKKRQNFVDTFFAATNDVTRKNRDAVAKEPGFLEANDQADAIITPRILQNLLADEVILDGIRDEFMFSDEVDLAKYHGFKDGMLAWFQERNIEYEYDRLVEQRSKTHAYLRNSAGGASGTQDPIQAQEKVPVDDEFYDYFLDQNATYEDGFDYEEAIVTEVLTGAYYGASDLPMPYQNLETDFIAYVKDQYRVQDDKDRLNDFITDNLSKIFDEVRYKSAPIPLIGDFSLDKVTMSGTVYNIHRTDALKIETALSVLKTHAPFRDRSRQLSLVFDQYSFKDVVRELGIIISNRIKTVGDTSTMIAQDTVFIMASCFCNDIPTSPIEYYLQMNGLAKSFLINKRAGRAPIIDVSGGGSPSAVPQKRGPDAQGQPQGKVAKSRAQGQAPAGGDTSVSATPSPILGPLASAAAPRGTVWTQQHRDEYDILSREFTKTINDTEKFLPTLKSGRGNVIGWIKSQFQMDLTIHLETNFQEVQGKKLVDYCTQCLEPCHRVEGNGDKTIENYGRRLLHDYCVANKQKQLKYSLSPVR